MAVGRKPNIIYILPDQWRFDAIGALGRNPVKTPNLDALAGHGIMLEGLYSESPVCQPARASLLLGRWPREHGLIDNELSKWAQPTRFPNPYLPTVARGLQDVGYHTVGLGKLNFWFPQVVAKDLIGDRFRSDAIDSDWGAQVRRLFGFGDLRDYRQQTAAYGFDEVHEEADKQSLLLYDSDYTDHLRDKQLLDGWREDIAADVGDFLGAYLAGRDVSMMGDAGPPTKPEALDPADTLDAFIGRRACEIVSAHDFDRPLFMQVGFVGPHPPYDTPAGFRERYTDLSLTEPVAGPPEGGDNPWGEYLEWTVERTGSGRFTNEAWLDVMRQYYARCSLIDDAIGDLVAALHERGQEDTWVVFGSDHGELLGDHGMVAKRLFYDSSIRVPGIIASLQLDQDPVTLTGLHQNFDMTATILDLAGAEAGWHRGRSLLDRDDADQGRHAVFSEIAGFLMVATSNHKLIVHEQTRTPQCLFDLQADPGETRDALDDPDSTAVVSRLMDDLVIPFLEGSTSVDRHDT